MFRSAPLSKRRCLLFDIRMAINFQDLLVPLVGMFLAVLVVGLFVKELESLISKKIKGRRRPEIFEAKEYLLTDNEKKMFYALRKALSEKYCIHCQTSLLELIKSDKSHALKRIGAKHMDFVITDHSTKILAVIELDDKSHNRPDRVARDKIVENILAGNHKLIRFKTQRFYRPEEIAERLEKESGIENRFKH